jgi:hypothetical protein
MIASAMALDRFMILQPSHQLSYHKHVAGGINELRLGWIQDNHEVF